MARIPTKLMNNSDRLAIINGVAEELATQVRVHLDRQTRTCCNCLWFDDKTEFCKPANARPPARVIVAGCEKYEDDIPF